MVTIVNPFTDIHKKIRDPDSFLQSAVTHKRQNYADRCRAAGKLFAVCAFEVSGGIYHSEMKSVLKRIHRGISERSAILQKPGSISVFRSRSKGPMLIPYHSNRLLPLVVADSASSFYDTKLNKKYATLGSSISNKSQPYGF
jgi:hypothetical protein